MGIALANKIRFTGFVVTYNDEKYLAQCLGSLSFCAQLLVVDLGSTDNSMDLARKYGAELHYHSHVPVVEQVYADYIDKVKNNWIIFLDPDEVLPVGIENRLVDIIERRENVGAIRVPWQFYFRGKPLRTTRWGRYDNSKIVVCHKERVNFHSHVHRGKKILEEYDIVRVPRLSFDDCIKHYWIDSYQELVEKHQRYLKFEGESRFHAGEKFSWSDMATSVVKGIYLSLFRFKGLFGGLSGVFLSIFWGWYIGMGWLSLRDYERNQPLE